MSPITYSLLLLIYFLSAPASAQYFIGPAASSAGSAGRASVDPGEASFLNPAAIAFLQKYNFSLYGAAAGHPQTGNSSLWGVSLADGTPGNIVPGAISYIRQITDPPSGASDTQQDLQVNLAVRPFRNFALGLTGHRLTDQILSNWVAAQYNQYNMHVGAILSPASTFGLGLVAYDFLPTGDGVPAPYHVQPTLAIGGNYLYQKTFRARLDLIRPDTQNDGHRINVGVGIETYIEESFVFRFGSYWKETADQDYFSAGFGYIGPKLSFDYSFQQDARNGANSRQLIDLWLPL